MKLSPALLFLCEFCKVIFLADLAAELEPDVTMTDEAEPTSTTIATLAHVVPPW